MTGVVRYQPTEGDFAAVGRGSFMRSLRRRRFHVRVAIMTALGAIVGGGLSWLDLQTMRPGYVMIGVLATLIWFAIVIVISYLLIPRRTRRLYRQQRAAGNTLTFAWDDVGITLESDRGHVTTPWCDYYDWYEDSAAFGFGLNEQLFHFVPKRRLDGDQIDDIRRHAGMSARRAS